MCLKGNYLILRKMFSFNTTTIEQAPIKHI